jgi:hypothetical protein
MPAHEGINWDQFSESWEKGHAPYFEGTDYESDIEQWSHGTTKWPKEYLHEAKDRSGEPYQNLQQHLKNEVNLPDQVQVVHRGGVPKSAKIRSGSIYPEWTGNNPNKEEFGIHHYGQDNKLHIYLVPREHIIGIGHEGEGEVFFDQGSRKVAAPAPGLGSKGKHRARKNLKGFK